MENQTKQLDERYSLTLKQEADFIHPHVAGVRTRETVMAITRDIIQACFEHGYRAVLVDVRKLHGSLTVTDTFMAVNRDFRSLASTLRPIPAVVDSGFHQEEIEFFDTVSYNAGYHRIHTFLDITRAIKWLRRE